MTSNYRKSLDMFPRPKNKTEREIHWLLHAINNTVLGMEYDAWLYRVPKHHEIDRPPGVFITEKAPYYHKNKQVTRQLGVVSRGVRLRRLNHEDAYPLGDEYMAAEQLRDTLLAYLKLISTVEIRAPWEEVRRRRLTI